MITRASALKDGIARALDLHPDLDTVDVARLGRRPCGGGCINETSLLTAPGAEFFLKTNADPPAGMFRAEAEGLRALRAAGGVRVPRPLAVGAPEVEGEAVVDGVAFVPCAESFLLMEYVAQGRRGGAYWEELGRGLAALHRATAPTFGFAHDNFIGTTPQPNAPSGDWVEFFATRRIEHQLRLARDAGHVDAGMARHGERLLARLDALLGTPAEPPALLHGDLWGGNHQPDLTGAPMLFDPAASYGRREADLAMTELFGGFDPAFRAAYEEAWPLADGYAMRRDVYNLYHLLNHLNLFGDAYAAQVNATLQRYGA